MLALFISKLPAKYIPQFNANEYSRVNIVGRSQINTFMGRDSVQVIIDELEIFEGLNQIKKLVLWTYYRCNYEQYTRKSIK